MTRTLRRLYGSVLALGVSTALLVGMIAGCSSGDASDSGSGSAQPAAATGGSYCDLYAARAAQGVKNFNEAMSTDLTDPSAVARQQEVAAAAKSYAEVSQADLEKVAPPDQLALLLKLDKAAKDSSKDGGFGASDESVNAIAEIPKQLNTWAKANCPAKYQSIFIEYDKVVD